jgi:hypothetical protein
MTKDSNRPIIISTEEWREIMSLPVVRDSWGLEDETPQDFRSMVYGVKFNFHSGCPGYVGDLYILQGDVLTGDAPMIFGRINGELQPIYD